jgi:hypothetical protein
MERLQLSVKKALQILFFSSAIGVLDDLQVRYLRLGNLGNNVEIAYQAAFLFSSAAVSYFVLYRHGWSAARNLSNLLMVFPVAALADNISIDMGTLKPYLVLIPREGYVWRQQVFGHTAALSYVAGWVNQQSLAPDLLNGYVASIILAAAYVIIQFAWTRKSNT